MLLATTGLPATPVNHPSKILMLADPLLIPGVGVRVAVYFVESAGFTAKPLNAPPAVVILLVSNPVGTSEKAKLMVEVAPFFKVARIDVMATVGGEPPRSKATPGILLIFKLILPNCLEE